MNKTAIRQSVRQMIQDEFTAALPYTWADDELDQYIEDTLIDLSQVQPYEKKITAVSNGTKKIDLTGVTGLELADLISIEKAEYPVDADPVRYRNVSRFGNELTVLMDAIPTSGENINLYCMMVHTLNESTSTLNRLQERLIILGSAGQAAINKALALYLQGKQSSEQINSAVTAIGSISEILTRALEDIADGRTNADGINEILASAKIALDKIDAEVAQAIEDLDAGRPLANAVTTGRGLSDYAQLASSGINNARGLLEEASGYFRQGQAKESLAATQLGLAGREIQTASTELNKASAYLRVVSAKTGLSTVGRALETWGRSKLTEYKMELRRLVKCRIHTEYSRS